MKQFLVSILVLLTMLVLLFVISMALDVAFVQAYTVRQFIIYFCMLVVFYIGLRIVYLINKTE